MKQLTFYNQLNGFLILHLRLILKSFSLIFLILKAYKKNVPEKEFSGIPLYLITVSPSFENSLNSISFGLAGILITSKMDILINW